MKKKNGFTLIELLSTLIILGIIATIAIQSYNTLIVKNDDSKYNYYWNFVEKASDLYFDARKVNMIDGECLSVNYQALVDKDYLKEEGVTCTGNIILRKQNKKYVYDDTNIECKSNNKVVKEKGEIEAVCPVTQVFTFDDNYERLNDIATSMTASIDKWENISTTHTVKKGYDLASSKNISFTECTGECGIYQNLTKSLILDKVYSWSVLLKANSGKTLKVGVGTNGIKTITTTGEWQKVSGEFVSTSTDSSIFSILSTNGWLASEDDLYLNSVIVYEKNQSLKNKLAFEIDVPFGENLPTPNRVGYTFTGWFTEKDGGTKIEKTTTVPKTKNIIYYAHWAKKAVKVNYNSNGGEGTMTSDNITYGNEYTIKNNTFTKTGYTFNCWKDNDNNKNFSIWKQTPITWNYNEDINLSALWKANTYNLAYTLNGGNKGTNSPNTATYDSNITISNPTKTVKVTGNANGTGATVGTATSKTQTFDGWTSTNINTQTAYYDSTPWTNTSTKTKSLSFKNLTPINGDTVTLTANWKPVVFNLPTVSKEGYQCNWNTKSDGSGTSYTSGSSYTPSATSSQSVDMYADCTANTYYVKYNKNGGSGTMSNSTHTYDVAKNLSANNFTKSGYEFNGWNTKSDGKGTSYSNKKSVKNLTSENDGIFNLYAQWKKEEDNCTDKMSRSFNYDGSGSHTEDDGSGNACGRTKYEVSLTIENNKGCKTKVYLNGNEIASSSGSGDSGSGTFSGVINNVKSVTTGSGECYVKWKVYFKD